MSDICISSGVCGIIGLESINFRCCLFSASFDQGVVPDEQIHHYGRDVIWRPDNLGLVVVNEDCFCEFLCFPEARSFGGVVGFG